MTKSAVNAMMVLIDLSITIEFLISRDLPQNEKEKELTECFEIIKNELKQTKTHYLKYQRDYDSINSEYICVLEDSFFELYEYVSKNKVDHIAEFGSLIAYEIIDLAQSTGKLTSKITEEQFNDFLNLARITSDLHYESLIKAAKPEKEMQLEEKQEIELKGKMYFEYTDKVISKRLFKRNLIIGLFVIFFSIGGIIVSQFGNLYWVIPQSVFLFLGIVIVIKSFIEREKVSCSSLLSSKRLKTRLTSNGAIVVENAVPIFKIVFYILEVASSFASLMQIIFSFTDKNIPNYISIIFACSTIVCVITLYLFVILRVGNSDDKKYFYLYNGQKYACSHRAIL